MKLRIAICQYDMEWMSPARNLERVEPMVASAEADVVVLPEMFATGFVTDNALAAQPMTGSIVEAMSSWAVRYGKAVVGSASITQAGATYNRMLFATPDGRVDHYDKRHLFSIGGEGKLFTAGDVRKVVEWRGVRFLLLVCYDLRFPVWSRSRNDYDAIICSASWPASRQSVWRTLLAARAIENQAYAIGVNRTGTDPAASYCGGSQIIDFKGRSIVNADDAECVVTTEIDTDALQQFRAKFPAWRDADEFELNIK